MPKHIFRLVSLIIGFVIAAVIAIPILTDDSFYRFGHYRADSVTEIAAKAPVYQTSRYCLACHTPRVALWSANSHKTVACEVCHGAAEGHPAKGKLPIPKDTLSTCTLCHEAMAGRPRTQPQVDPAKHNPSGQQCTTCHNPHSPKIVISETKVSGNAAAGKKRADEACASCHGVKGISDNDTWPNLAGQKAAYLAHILRAYKSGDQNDVMMTPLAQALSDADIQNIATYYASLSCSGARNAKVSGDAAAGKELAKNCAGCHGETGMSANPAWPDIAGQKPGYLANVLKAFRAGLRKDPTMASVSRGLSDTDIENLAAYYAGQSCGPQTQKGK